MIADVLLLSYLYDFRLLLFLWWFSNCKTFEQVWFGGLITVWHEFKGSVSKFQNFLDLLATREINILTHRAFMM